MSERINFATNIALVNANGIVENIIWGMFYNTAEYTKWGYTAIVINNLGVQIGDRYDSQTGKFYDVNGNVIKTLGEIYDDEITEMDEFIIDALYHDIIDDAE